MSSRNVKKYRGPSRPVDPRYAPGRPRRRGPDTFGIALITISTAFVIVFMVFLGTQGNTATTTTTTIATPDTSSANNPAATAAPSSDAQATQTMVAFTAETAGLPRITPEEAKPSIMAGQVKLIDVREKTIYTTEHITGAINIPYTEAQTRVSEFPKTGNIILYCQ
jgi:hypothetical protein